MPWWLTSRLRSRGSAAADFAAASSAGADGCGRACAAWPPINSMNDTRSSVKRRIAVGQYPLQFALTVEVVMPMKKISVLSALSAALAAGVCAFATAQVTAADYQRAQSLRQQYESAAVFVPDTPTWVGTTHRFYYRRSLANGFEFVMVDADTRQKQPAFDHAAAGRVAVARVGPRLLRRRACPSRTSRSTTR